MTQRRRNQSERRAKTRRALLDAAAALFAERGYHKVSLDEIAARAGLTRGALHYNFGGKADLLLTLLDERLAARGEAIDGADPAALAAALPFDREFSLLFLEFAAAAARDVETGRALRAGLDAGRSANLEATRGLLDRAGVDPAHAEQLVHIGGAFVNGLSIEALAGADLDALNQRFAVFLERMIAGFRVAE